MPEALQLPLYARAPMLRDAAPVAAPLPVGDVDGLREYQRTAVTEILAKLTTNRSTLLVMATGTGKTQTFGAVAKHWDGRVLVLAHRDELIQQARSRLAVMTGEFVDVEQAQFTATGARITIGSVQTLCRAARLKRFAPDRFDLVIVDEAHHAVAATYRRILDHFGAAKVLGVTATPDRADESAMEQVFETVAFTYDIQDGIRDRFLCPVRVQSVTVDSINLAAVKTTAGDLNQGQLDAVMSSEESLHGIARPTLELAGDRRTIVFTTSVDNAHRMAEIFNRYRSGCARAVDGTTSFDLRRSILRGHKGGDFQFLVNVGVLTEGYDDPAVSCVAMGRPTKSRALYAQCIGRGLRPAGECEPRLCKARAPMPGFPRWCAACGGSIDYPVGDSPADRGARLLDGPKTDCLVLDFVGNSGKHTLVSSLDILAGKWDDAVVARAKKDAKDAPGMGAAEALERAAKALEEEKKAGEARRASLKASVNYKATSVDPFAVLGVRDDSGPMDGAQRATPGQIETLAKFRLDIPAVLSRMQASKLIGAAIARKQRGLTSYRQIKALSRYGIDAARMYFSTASKLMDAIQANGWRALPSERVTQIIASRTAGEDG